VDVKKISQGVYIYEESKVCTICIRSYYVVNMILLQAVPKPTVPIIHFTEARPPFILCVKWVSPNLVLTIYMYNKANECAT